jgi:hypothetical protein
VSDELRWYLGEMVKAFRSAERQGAPADQPEGSRYVLVSETLADAIVSNLEDFLSVSSVSSVAKRGAH